MGTKLKTIYLYTLVFKKCKKHAATGQFTTPIYIQCIAFLSYFQFLTKSVNFVDTHPSKIEPYNSYTIKYILWRP